MKNFGRSSQKSARRFKYFEKRRKTRAKAIFEIVNAVAQTNPLVSLIEKDQEDESFCDLKPHAKNVLHVQDLNLIGPGSLQQCLSARSFSKIGFLQSRPSLSPPYKI